MSRAKNLTDADIDRIVGILDGWSGKLSWDLLIRAVFRHTKSTYSRQALNNHQRIKDAFTLRKRTISSKTVIERKKADSPELQAALDRLTRLEGENQRLRMENDRLLERFVTWAYNAHTRGLDERFLSQPLPPVNRATTLPRPKLASTVKATP